MKNLILKILFVIGIIALLVLFAVSVVRIVPKIVGSLGSTNGSSEKTETNSKISVLTNTEEIISEKPFGLTWRADESISQEDGVFAITYTCTDDLTFDIIGKNGARKTLLCEVPFTLGKTPVELALEPKLTEEETMRDVNLSISFFKPEQSIPTHRGEKMVSVKSLGGISGSLASNNTQTDLGILDGESGSSETEEETNTPDTNTETGTSEVSTPLPPAPATPADLVIADTKVVGNAIEFTISNIGGKPSGVFFFSYTLPGETTPRVSPLQPSLNPQERLGAKITLIQSTTGGVVNLKLDSDNRVAESRENNNTASVTLGLIPGTPLPPTNGLSDLVVSNLSLSKNTLTSQENLSLSFSLSNTGAATSAFTLEIVVPTLNQGVTPSGDGLCALRDNVLVCAVPAMGAGEKSNYAFTINNLARGMNQQVRVSADTQNVVRESNELNNQSSVFVNIY